VSACRVLVASALAIVLAAGALPAAAGAAGSADVRIDVDRAMVSTQLGKRFGLRVRITNTGSRPASGLIAHLNVLSLKPGVYVDPEDWSSDRTRYLPPIPAGAAVTTRWSLSAVTAGRLGIYVTVVPRNAAGTTPVAGPTVRVDVADRTTLNAGGVVPLALGVPVAVALLAGWLRLRRRRPRGAGVRV
jgi:hypothetical protein